jgi:hypothetical protein
MVLTFDASCIHDAHRVLLHRSSRRLKTAQGHVTPEDIVGMIPLVVQCRLDSASSSPFSSGSRWRDDGRRWRL